MGKSVKKDIIHAEGIDIGIYTTDFENEFISLTDIAKKREGEYPGYVIQNWMRSRSTISFIGLWEVLHNPGFNCLEFEAIKNEAGDNSFVMTPKRWIETTNAIGITSKQGRYAATYAHRDIAFEFASWIDMWITGFDVPTLTYMYNDKPLKKHMLIQTISRVNRKYPGKEYGLIIYFISRQ